MAVDADRRGIIFRAKLDPRDVRQQHARTRRVRLDDDVAELLGRLQPRLCRHRRIEHLSLRLRHSADLARGDVDILVLDRGDDVARHQLEARQLVRVEPDRASHICEPKTLTSPTPGMRDRFVLDIGCEPVGNVDVRALVGFVIDADDHQEVGRALGHRHALLLHLLRQSRDRLLDLVLDLDLRDVGIDALVEHGGDRDLPARARRRAEIEQAVEPGQRLLDHLRDAALESFSRRAGIGRANVDLGRRDVGILRDGKRRRSRRCRPA